MADPGVLVNPKDLGEVAHCVRVRSRSSRRDLEDGSRTDVDAERGSRCLTGVRRRRDPRRIGCRGERRTGSSGIGVSPVRPPSSWKVPGAGVRETRRQSEGPET